MLCPSCFGQHWVIRNGQMLPCPECAGIGEVHCCDGLTAQPDSYASVLPSREAAETDSHPSKCRAAR